MSQLKNYIMLSTDAEGSVKTYPSNATVRACKAARQLSNELGTTVYVSRTNASDSYGGSEQGDTEIASYQPSK